MLEEFFCLKKLWRGTFVCVDAGNHNKLVNPGRPCRKLWQAWKNCAEAMRDQSVVSRGCPLNQL